jgi:hypothetical protein
MSYRDEIHSAVEYASKRFLSAEQMCTPLIEALAAITVGAAHKTGASTSDLLEIMIYRLTQEVSNAENRSRR